jgi:[acyl-carrier-protein] S-malonyltransferase
MAYVLLFSGQANQHADMLPWLESAPAAAPVLRQMEARIGSDWRAALADPLRRADNGFAQVVITGTALAAWAALQAAGLSAPLAVAGYSVGELAAFAAAGAFSPASAMALAQERARCMDQAVAGLATGLLSVTGMARERAQALCPALECAIDLGPEQAVFAGLDADLDAAFLRLPSEGAQCTRLGVRVASHSSWMRAALAPFEAALNDIVWSNINCPLALNATGGLGRQPQALRSALVAQVASTVQWESCMQALAERQPHCVLEIGAGAALARLWNARYPTVSARSMDEFKDLQGVLDWLHRNAAAD